MDINEVKLVWNKVKDELEANIPDHIFCTWITPLEAVDYEIRNPCSIVSTSYGC